MAPDTVNVQDAFAIGSEQSKQFSPSLRRNFHLTIPKQVKTMEVFKKAVTIKGKVNYDVETLFSRWQQRSMEVADVFQFEKQSSSIPKTRIC